jgi:hypothetical protein
MKLFFMNQGTAILTIPSQFVNGIGGPNLFDYDADGVGVADGVVRGVGREKVHVSFVYRDVYTMDVRKGDEGFYLGGKGLTNEVICCWVDCFEEHGSFVLVEIFWGCVYVVICSGVWAAYDLLGH